MVKFNSIDFLKNNKVIGDYYFAKNPKTSSLYIDFDKKNYYIQISSNGIQFGKIKMEFDFEGDVPEDFKQIYMDSKKFYGMCELHDEIYISFDNDKVIFYNDDNVYDLNVDVDPCEFNFDMFENDIESEDIVVVNDDFFYSVKKAFKYLSINELANPIYRTVFINNNYLFSRSENNEVFETKVNMPNMFLSFELIEFILHCGIDSNIIFYDKFERIISKNMDVILTKHVLPDSFSPPNFQSDTFKEFYYHDTFFKVDVSDFEIFLKQFKIFYGELPNKIFYLQFDGNKLTCEIKSQSNNITRIFEVNESNIPEDFRFIFDAEVILKALTILEGEEATIMVSNKIVEHKKNDVVAEIETEVCNIFMDGDDTEHIVFKRYKI